MKGNIGCRSEGTPHTDKPGVGACILMFTASSYSVQHVKINRFSLQAALSLKGCLLYYLLYRLLGLSLL